MKQISSNVKKNVSGFIQSTEIGDETSTKLASLKWKKPGSSK